MVEISDYNAAADCRITYFLDRTIYYWRKISFFSGHIL